MRSETDLSTDRTPRVASPAGEAGERAVDASLRSDGNGTGAGDAAFAAEHETIIQPRRGWQGVNFRELFQYRELAGFLALREIKVRYKQTALGAMWAVIQPVANMVVFTVFFNGLAGVPSEGAIPYPIFTLCALIPWQLFENAVGQASNSLVANERLITKTYFPRLIIPISAILSSLVDFGIALVILAVLMVWYGIVPGLALLTLPLFLMMASALALGVGLWLSALNVQYRDVRYAIPFLLRIWFFATPIVYSASRVPQRWQLVYALNPMCGVVEGFRWALLGQGSVSGWVCAVSAGATFVLLWGGLYYFRQMEAKFSDIV